MSLQVCVPTSFHLRMVSPNCNRDLAMATNWHDTWNEQLHECVLPLALVQHYWQIFCCMVSISNKSDEWHAKGKPTGGMNRPLGHVRGDCTNELARLPISVILSAIYYACSFPSDCCPVSSRTSSVSRCRRRSTSLTTTSFADVASLCDLFLRKSTWSTKTTVCRSNNGQMLRQVSSTAKRYTLGGFSCCCFFLCIIYLLVSSFAVNKLLVLVMHVFWVLRRIH